jgi:hypothetical protein
LVEHSPGLRDGGYMLGLSDPGLNAAERPGVADAAGRAAQVPAFSVRPLTGEKRSTAEVASRAAAPSG